MLTGGVIERIGLQGDGQIKTCRGKRGGPGPPVHEDLVERDFTATAPNELWLTDITEHWTGEGKLRLCAIKATSQAGSSATRSTTG